MDVFCGCVFLKLQLYIVIVRFCKLFMILIRAYCGCVVWVCCFWQLHLYIVIVRFCKLFMILISAISGLIFCVVARLCERTGVAVRCGFYFFCALSSF